MAMPFWFSPPRNPDDAGAPPRGWRAPARVALEMGKVLLGQLIASALRRWWE